MTKNRHISPGFGSRFAVYSNGFLTGVGWATCFVGWGSQILIRDLVSGVQIVEEAKENVVKLATEPQPLGSGALKISAS